MAVGQEDLLRRDAGLLDRGKDAREIAARIDDRGAVRRVAPQDRAVLLEQGHGDDGDAKRHERGWRFSKGGSLYAVSPRRQPESPVAGSAPAVRCTRVR